MLHDARSRVHAIGKRPVVACDLTDESAVKVVADEVHASAGLELKNDAGEHGCHSPWLTGVILSDADTR